MKKQNYILGLDLGVNSLGWACIKQYGGKPAGILDIGSRVFEAGVNEMEKDGKGVSRNLERRIARQQRRMLERRARRKLKVFHFLQRNGLLPKGEADSGDKRNQLLNRLDQEILQSRLNGEISPEDNLPYLLRARALHEKLTQYELGRAIYHLSQRRGYRSNRKAGGSSEEEGQVASGIEALRASMESSKFKTLGEYFNSLDPHKKRIRERWTAREMYMDEFDLIWNRQKEHYPEHLTVEFREQLEDAIFHQRPLKSVKHLIGRCSLEAGKHRAPIASLEFQRFRFLQRINDLEVIEATGEIRPLSDEERNELHAVLEDQGDRTFKQIKKLLSLKDCIFNLEEGGEKRLPGNRSFQRISKAFGDSWKDLSGSDREQTVEEILSFHNSEALARRAQKLWKLDKDTARVYSLVKLEDGYGSYSRKAYRKLLPLLEAGTRLNTAIKEEYGEQENAPDPINQLPPALIANPILRNPVVSRALTELKKVMNAIIRKHGKPELIRLELVRDLKKSPKQRENAIKNNRSLQKEREKVKDRIEKETTISDPRRNDVERVMLADECNWNCPFCGKAFSMKDVISDAPCVDTEHIIPFSRSLDNTFLNKTLAHRECNAAKGQQTPWEAFSGDEIRWSEILGRVLRFKSGRSKEKLRRFKMRSEEVELLLDTFTEKDLRETAYAARLAADYLGLLYGGAIDADGKRRVQVIGGQATSHFRNEWELNSILSDGPRKSRDDHRHHAVDAVVIGLSNAGMVRSLSAAAGRAQLERRKRFGKVEAPWKNFKQDVREAVDGIIVSHRVDHTLRGALHKETIYSPPRDKKGIRCDEGEYVHIRVKLTSLTRKTIENIVDPEVQNAVRICLGDGIPMKVFADPEKRPVLPNGTRVGKVRISKKLHVTPIASEHRQRHVVTGSNHHMVIFETTDVKGNRKWLAEVVTLFEAIQRKKRGEPVIKRTHHTGAEFALSLSRGDVLRLAPSDRPELVMIRDIPQSQQISFLSLTEARKKTDIKASGAWRTGYPSTLMKLECEKVTITPIGEVHVSND